MENPKICRIYEGSAIRQVTGDSIRPGGFTLTDRAVNICALPAGAKVLDVGCGTGATVEYLTSKYQIEAVGVDPSELLLRQGRQRRPDLALFQAVGECLPFYLEEIDCVFAECTLSLMDDPDRALKECHRVLRNGGYLAVTDIYARNPAAVPELRSLPLASCVTGAMSQEEVEKKLKHAGFQLILWEDHSDLLKELMIQLIMTHGSMNSFWQQAGSEDCSESCAQVIKNAKPGYYLLIAQKSSNTSNNCSSPERG